MSKKRKKKDIDEKQILLYCKKCNKMTLPYKKGGNKMNKELANMEFYTIAEKIPVEYFKENGMSSNVKQD